VSNRYGKYGGSYIPEMLHAPVEELSRAWGALPPSFFDEVNELLKTFAGRPTPLTDATHFAKEIGAGKVFLKREDLLHTGAHKINNCIGQCLLAKRMGKKRILAETGAGQHGVATATACAHLGMPCTIFMGKVDVERQDPNVKRMRLMGADVVSVNQGSATLKEAINEAMRTWTATYEETHYCLGSVLGPYPYPQMVARFQSIIGEETREAITPDAIIACIGGGSNAIGIFNAFLDDPVTLIGVEAGGTSFTPGEHAARFHGGKPGVFHGCYTYLLQNEEGQIQPTHSISAGLDYPAIGPEHASLHDENRVEYVSCNDKEALHAFELLSQTEGIIPALESAHALGYLIREASRFKTVVVNLSGRGDKDLPTIFANHPDTIKGELRESN
jgi:tryptophan synthase beta subunit